MAKITELRTPTGVLILGTYDMVPGCALIQDPRKDENGNLEFDYAGETRLYWDAQETQTDGRGSRLFVDENGDTWPESALTLVEAEEK